VGPRVQVASTSGGTDIVSGFAGSAPTTPVWPGEISAPLLGVALDAYDAEGRPVTGEVGELVVTRPMPSMPVCFWNDPDGSRYRDAYFGVYPGVWRHGDWITRTARGGVVVSGRSGSTLNRHASGWAAPTSTWWSTPSPASAKASSSARNCRTAVTGCRSSSSWNPATTSPMSCAPPSPRPSAPTPPRGTSPTR
jgi:hypothetical protein